MPGLRPFEPVENAAQFIESFWSGRVFIATQVKLAYAICQPIYYTEMALTVIIGMNGSNSRGSDGWSGVISSGRSSSIVRDFAWLFVEVPASPVLR